MAQLQGCPAATNLTQSSLAHTAPRQRWILNFELRPVIDRTEATRADCRNLFHRQEPLYAHLRAAKRLGTAPVSG